MQLGRKFRNPYCNERLKTINSKALMSSKSIIHFAHANGFHPEAYQPFLKHFEKDCKVITSTFRPFWGGQNPNQLNSWHQFADDLIQYLDSQNFRGGIGMGHSLGGTTTAIAAMKRPDLFSKIVLLDPVIFEAPLFYLINLLPQSLRKKIVPVAKISRKRKDQWGSKEEVYQSWRSKRIFKKIPDEVLKNLVDYAVVPNGNGQVKLAYSKEWETQVYITVPLIFSKIKKLKTPMVVVRGADTDVITPKVWSAWKAAQPQNEFINYPNAGHLVPFEYPAELAKKILPLLDSEANPL
jgi:pimeloyl-ACP methyl ester carboxylesterase